MRTQELQIPMGAVWLGSLPMNWLFEATYYRERSFENVGASVHSSVRSVCLRLHLGGRMRSGVLGAEFVPDSTNQLLIRVGVLERDDEDVYAGLPSEFADTILGEVVGMTEDIKSLGAGCLRFECASWHRLYSDKITFSLLARSLVYLLNSNWETASEESVTELIKKAGEPIRRKIESEKGK